MTLTAAATRPMLETLALVAGWTSLHSADPGSTGAAELAGGRPAYERQPVVWQSVPGMIVSANVIQFDVPGTTTATHLGYWDSPVGGVFYGARQLDEAQTFGEQGTYTIDAGGITEALV